MRVVRHKTTLRLLYRQCPDFKWGMGIPNAIATGDVNYPPEELEEVEVTKEDWDAEISLRFQESSLALNELLDVRRDNPQRIAYKASQLYGLTHEQLDTYIDNNVTTLATAKEYIRKLSHVVLYLVKQTKLDV